MHSLDDAPSSVVDPRTATPRFGAYRGTIARRSLRGTSTGPIDRLLHQKRWFYGAIVTETHYLGFSVVDMGYAVAGYAYALTRVDRRMQVDRSLVTPPLVSGVRQSDALPYGVRLRHPLGRMRIERYGGEDQLSVDVEIGRLEIHASLDCESAPSPVTTVAPGQDRGASVSEKQVLCPVRGEARIHGIRHRLDGGWGAYDFTHGFLPHHTMWRGAFLMGRSKQGDPVALTLADGASGATEGALWVGTNVYGVAEGRFTHDEEYPLSEWRVSAPGGAADLRFDPHAMHTDGGRLGPMRMRFVQPVGAYTGHLRPPVGPRIELESVMGVIGTLDSRW